jgi:NAD(P)H-dependent FMN reductase
MPAKQQRIAVVIGSTRPSRICAGIAAWAAELPRGRSLAADF